MLRLVLDKPFGRRVDDSFDGQFELPWTEIYRFVKSRHMPPPGCLQADPWVHISGTTPRLIVASFL